MKRLSLVLLVIGVLIFIILTFPGDAQLTIKSVRLEMAGFACVFGSFLAARFGNPPVW